MAATQFPLPITTDRAAAQFANLTTYLTAIARTQFPSAATDADARASYLSQQIRSAQARLEAEAETKFFVTRFCTEELALQEELELGTDFDEYIQPLNYDHDQHRANTCRTQLPWTPLVPGRNADLTQRRVVQQFVFSAPGGARTIDLPGEWLQADCDTGTLHILPNAIVSHGLTLPTFLALTPYEYRQGIGQRVPLFVHVRFSAGMLQLPADPGDWDDWDPEARPFDTIRSQVEVADFQQAIAQQVGAQVFSALVPVIARGGVSLSVDGLSRSANPQVLTQQAQMLESAVRDWISRYALSRKGLQTTFI